MSDNLKKYIAENNAEFDALPNTGHFERFKQKQGLKTIVKKSKQPVIPVFIKIAAVFILVFGIGWLVFNLGKIQASQEFASNTSSINISNDMEEVEFFFTEQVNLKKKEVLAYSSSNNKATQHIMLELEKLELEYLDLKEELAINNNNEQVINAMIENYRMRLNLLEKLLQQLKKSNKIKQQHHEKIQA